jgi:hypothetical protein
LSLFAEELVRIAAPGYEESADLVPIASAGWAAYGFFVLVYRTSNFPSRRAWFVGLTTLSSIVFAASAQVFIPLWGAYGASAAVITGWLVGIVGVLIRAQRGPDPTPYQYGRIFAGLLFAVGWLGLAKLLGPEELGAAQVAVDVLALLAYPLALGLSSIVPKRHIVSALRVLRVGFGPRWATRVRARLTHEDHAVIELLLRQNRSVDEVARARGIGEDHVRMRLVEALRRCSDLGRSREGDELLGDYLLMRGAFAEREAAARAMFANGVDPLDADVLVHAATALRRLPGRRWRALAPSGASAWPAPSPTPSTSHGDDRAPQPR